MITGDNTLTACQVAKDLSMTPRPVLILSPSGTASTGLGSITSSAAGMLNRMRACVRAMRLQVTRSPWSGV
jgi:magnesium-transporting ATPase (P-type)